MPGERDHDVKLRNRARLMRKEPTDAERALWRLLRDRRLGHLKFRRQVPIGGYIADFYCIKAKVVVELDGGQHLEHDALAYDAERTAVFNSLGIRVIRFNNVQVLKEPDSVCATLYRDVRILPSPQPSPGVPGEGVNRSYVRSSTSPS